MNPHPLRSGLLLARDDVAALAAAAVASSIGTLGAAGPYDLSGFLLGISIAAVLFSYLRLNRRNHWQSAAVGLVVGVVLIPILCFPYEAWQIERIGTRIFCLLKDQCSATTWVSWWAPPSIWLLFSVGTYALDRWHQKALPADDQR